MKVLKGDLVAGVPAMDNDMIVFQIEGSSVPGEDDLLILQILKDFVKGIDLLHGYRIKKVSVCTNFNYLAC